MANALKNDFDEQQYTLSADNMGVAEEMVEALESEDQQRIDELAAKMVLPLSLLKAIGKEKVAEYGFPTLTAELANDTEWLK